MCFTNIYFQLRKYFERVLMEVICLLKRGHTLPTFYLIILWYVFVIRCENTDVNLDNFKPKNILLNVWRLLSGGFLTVISILLFYSALDVEYWGWWKSRKCYIYKSHCECRIRSRNCLSFSSSCVHPRVLMGSVLLHI